MKVLLSSISNVKSFSELAVHEKGKVTVRSGYYVVDGKSILGLFSLDLSKPISVECSDEFVKTLQSEMPKNIVE